ncbi:MAG: hypothetical protein KDD10_19095 [Phaeodactylibacter sp.]|nr:hypothetical protein [Phaeodactylibacter sp.]
MAFYKKVNPTGNADDTVIAVAGKTGCCGDSATEQTWANTAFNIGANTINGIVIDGTTYTFATAADDQDKLYAGIVAAFASAGYLDIENAGVVITGAASATVVTIKTTATLTVLDGASGDVTMTAS